MPNDAPAATAPAAEEPKVISQDQLLKSLQDIEKLSKGEVIEEPAPAAPVVAETPAAPSAASVVEETASEDLKKGLNASPLLKEIVGKLGKHVDDTLEGLRKSIDGQSARDMAILGALEGLNKSLKEQGEKIETIGKEPAATANARPVTATTDEVLAKGVDNKKVEGETDPVRQAAQAKKMVLGGLEKLVKSASDANDQKRFTTALIKFESTGVIDDVMLAEARSAMVPTAASA